MLRVDTDAIRSADHELNYIAARLRMVETEMREISAHLANKDTALDECRLRILFLCQRLEREYDMTVSQARTLESVADRYDRCERKCTNVAEETGGGKKFAADGFIERSYVIIPDPVPPWRPIPILPPVPPIWPRFWPGLIIWPFILIPWIIPLFGVNVRPGLRPGSNTHWKVKHGVLPSIRRRPKRNPFYVSPHTLSELFDSVLASAF